MKKIALIDNYDSFTYNLVHYLEDLNCEVMVFRNDEFELEELKEKKILGICLGHQAIGEVFGAQLRNLPKVYHGVTDTIKQTGTDSLFFNLPKQLQVGRYHSWVINKDDFPEALEITSLSENGDIMSIRHKQFNLKGIQFHPESILTPQGKTILSNWLSE